MGNHVFNLWLKDRKVDYVSAMNELKNMGFDVKDGIMPDMICKIDESVDQNKAIEAIQSTGKFGRIVVY